MKALTVLQPWAQLLMVGGKRHEIRTWKTNYRGPLFIHAGLTFTQAARARCARAPLRALLAQAGIHYSADLPRGALLGTITLEDCVPTEQFLYTGAAGCDGSMADFQPGRWAWIMSNPQLLEAPFPYRGQLGVFEVPERVVSSE